MLYKDFRTSITKCPFCSKKNRIIVDYESAFITYALAPYHPHHLLVIPKRHVESFLLLNAEEAEEIGGLLRFGMKLLHTHGYHNASILVRDGKEAGKSIPHLHYHIIPNIQIGDLDHYGQERRILSKTEIMNVVKDMKKAEKKLSRK